MASPYKHKVVVEATKDTEFGEEVYQRITFEQFYETNEAQVEEQFPLFKRVSDAVEKHSVKARDLQFPEVQDWNEAEWFAE